MTKQGGERAFKEGEPSVRVHVWLYAEDVAWIDAQCAGGWDNATTRSKFIRLALRRIVRAMQAKAEQDASRVHAEGIVP
jgi:hypothetical protein